MECRGTLNVKGLLKCFGKDQFPMLSDSGLASKNPVLKPWFSATFRPVTLCNLFLWEICLCSAFCCALTCRLLMFTCHWLLFEPCAGDHRSRLCCFLVHNENASMSSQRCFRLHKTKFKIVSFSQHLEHVFVNINFQRSASRVSLTDAELRY